MKALVIVDMQNDFITGALRNEEGIKIVPEVKKYADNFDGDIYFTMDTHNEDYLSTREGINLPVTHCIKNSQGWEIVPELESLWDAAQEKGNVIIKPSFGSRELGKMLEAKEYDEIHFVGVCTDICVISNVLITKAYLPEAKVLVHGSLCAGVTPESHNIALEAMKACQVEVD